MALTEQQEKALGLILTHGPGTADDWSFKKVAEACGVSPESLRLWRKKPEFKERMNQDALDDQVSRVRRALFDKAVVKNDTQAIKTWLDRYDEPVSHDDPLEEVLGYSRDELRHTVAAIVSHYGGNVDLIPAA